jgi:diacylglycerol kinase family enzyme
LAAAAGETEGKLQVKGGSVPQHETYRPTAGERVAAAGSLVTVVVAAALALIGVVLNFIALLIAIVGLLVCVTAGWYAVSRRGTIRVIGLIVVVVALAAMITGLVLDDFSALRLLLVVVVAAVSVLLARYALRTSRSRLRAFTEHLTPVAPAKRPVLIMNLKSGGGKAEKFRLADECRKRGIEPIILQPGDDLLQLADDAVDRGADVIGMAGGDGSQALVATVASRRRVPHVCIPAGTRNHFALDLGLDRDDVVGALDAFSDGVERAIDLAKVNGRVFVNNASLGLYAKVVQSPEYRDAKLKTATTMLPEMLGPEATPLDLRYRGPDGSDYPTAHLILVSNDPYQLAHLGGRGTRERLDAGVLGILAARIADAADARRFVTLEAAGQVRRFPGWQEWSAPTFKVGSGAPVEIGIDGEALVMDPPLVFESLPRALRVRLPRHAVRPSPAARTVQLLEGSTLSELGRVAAGRPAALSRSSSRP